MGREVEGEIFGVLLSTCIHLRNEERVKAPVLYLGNERVSWRRVRLGPRDPPAMPLLSTSRRKPCKCVAEARASLDAPRPCTLIANLRR